MRQLNGNVGLALTVAGIVAMSGCGPAGGALIGGVIGAIGILLGLAGCASSHSQNPGSCSEGIECNPFPDADDDGYTEDVDCDDNNAAVHPDAAEICNDGIDNDCDDELCEADTCSDADGDGHEAGMCAPDGDCDDANSSVHPGAEEVCNDGIDNDCDGEDCVEIVNTCLDADGDDYGIGFCLGDDCDDANAAVHRGAEEVCNDGLDNDCDGEQCEVEINTCTDADGDGYGEGGWCALDGDCNDVNADIHPSAPDPCGDGVDTNCDGADGVAGDDCVIINGMLEVDSDTRLA